MIVGQVEVEICVQSVLSHWFVVCETLVHQNLIDFVSCTEPVSVGAESVAHTSEELLGAQQISALCRLRNDIGVNSLATADLPNRKECFVFPVQEGTELHAVMCLKHVENLAAFKSRIHCFYHVVLTTSLVYVVIVTLVNDLKRKLERYAPIVQVFVQIAIQVAAASVNQFNQSLV